MLQDGSKLWNQKLQGSIAVSPLPDSTEPKLYVATIRGHCYCVDENTGLIHWQHNCQQPIFGSPAQISNQIFFPSVHGHLLCLSASTGDLLRTFEAGGSIFSSTVPYRQNLIFGCHDKNLYIVKPSIDSCIMVGKVELDSEVSSSVCVFVEGEDTFVICVCNSGILYLINFFTLRIIKRITFPSEIFSSPVVSEKKVYIGCRDNYVYCIDISEYLPVK